MSEWAERHTALGPQITQASVWTEWWTNNLTLNTPQHPHKSRKNKLQILDRKYARDLCGKGLAPDTHVLMFQFALLGQLCPLESLMGIGGLTILK
jgi:hypothetical protein